MSKLTVLQQLQQLSDSSLLPMHMPGHKRNIQLANYLAAIGAGLDITEIVGHDCLHQAEGYLKQAQEQVAQLWQSTHSYLLVNGSTGGILSGIHSATKRGDTILMARGCHQAVYHAVELCGLQTVYCTQEITPQGYCLPVTVAELTEQLQQHPEVSLVVLTSPTYEGWLADLKSMVALCHAQNIPLMVDEAHGAHLGFTPYFTGGAVQAGADLVIQSLHKTLPSVTQTAVAHLQGSLLDAKRLERSISYFETSSPSYLFMASIDGCASLLAKQGQSLFAAWQERLAWFYGQCTQLQHLSIVTADSTQKDPSKVVITTDGCDIDGMTLKRRLREEYQIELEMAYGDYALAMTGMGDTQESMERLWQALSQIDQTVNESEKETTPYPSVDATQVCSIPQSAQLPWEAVPLSQAVGRVSASHLWAYPPGIPLVVAGEVLQEKNLQLLLDLEGQGVAIQDSYGLWKQQVAVICKTALDEMQNI